MRARILTLSYSPSLGAIDDGPLTDLLRDKDVLDLREHFFQINGIPHVACLVLYHMRHAAANGEVAVKPTARDKSRPDPKEGLDERQRALFDHIREWRSKTAHKEGVPPYVILTNRELVAIIKESPESLTALVNIEELGRKKVERHGSKILALLNGSSHGSSAENSG